MSEGLFEMKQRALLPGDRVRAQLTYGDKLGTVVQTHTLDGHPVADILLDETGTVTVGVARVWLQHP